MAGSNSQKSSKGSSKTSTPAKGGSVSKSNTSSPAKSTSKTNASSPAKTPAKTEMTTPAKTDTPPAKVESTPEKEVVSDPSKEQQEPETLSNDNNHDITEAEDINKEPEWNVMTDEEKEIDQTMKEEADEKLRLVQIAMDQHEQWK